MKLSWKQILRFTFWAIGVFLSLIGFVSYSLASQEPWVFFQKTHHSNDYAVGDFKNNHPILITQRIPSDSAGDAQVTFGHGCGTGCSVSVTMRTPVEALEIRTSTGEQIRRARQRNLRGDGR